LVALKEKLLFYSYKDKILKYEISTRIEIFNPMISGIWILYYHHKN